MLSCRYDISRCRFSTLAEPDAAACYDTLPAYFALLIIDTLMLRYHYHHHAAARFTARHHYSPPPPPFTPSTTTFGRLIPDATRRFISMIHTLRVTGYDDDCRDV